MNATQRAETWAKINALLREHEDAQQDAIREAVAKQWEDLRTALQVVALEEPGGGGDTS